MYEFYCLIVRSEYYSIMYCTVLSCVIILIQYTYSNNYSNVSSQMNHITSTVRIEIEGNFRNRVLLSVHTVHKSEISVYSNALPSPHYVYIKTLVQQHQKFQHQHRQRPKEQYKQQYSTGTTDTDMNMYCIILY